MNSNAQAPRSRLPAIFRPLWVKLVTLGTGAVGLLSAYDAASNQFGWGKLPALLAWIAGLIPAWGWVTLLQTVILLALIDYVRRQRLSPSVAAAHTDPRIEELLLKQKAIIDDYQRMSALEARFTGELDGIKLAIQRANDTYATNLHIIERKIESTESLSEKVEANRVDTSIHRKELERINASIEKLGERTRGSFMALQNREKLANIENEMLKTAATLYERLHSGETYSEEDWSQWIGHLVYWEMQLEWWIVDARWYAPSVEKRIKTIEEKSYAGPWTVRDDQIPTAEGTRLFRKFRILQRQWDDVRKDVQSGLAQVAFIGMSEEAMQRGSKR